MRSRAAKATAAATAVVVWSGLLLQFYLSTTSGRDATFLLNAFRYFGYFTILTNVFIGLVVTAPVLPEGWCRRLTSPSVRAAGATYIAMVALVYWLLLRPQWNPQGRQLIADFLLHGAGPALYLGHWLAFVEKGTLRWRSVRSWLVYPVAYFLFVLARGALVGAYPYPFVDVNLLGYVDVTANAAGFLAAFALLGTTVVGTDRAVGRLADRRRRPSRARNAVPVDPIAEHND